MIFSEKTKAVLRSNQLGKYTKSNFLLDSGESKLCGQNHHMILISIQLQYILTLTLKVTTCGENPTICLVPQLKRKWMYSSVLLEDKKKRKPGDRTVTGNGTRPQLSKLATETCGGGSKLTLPKSPRSQQQKARILWHAYLWSYETKIDIRAYAACNIPL